MEYSIPDTEKSLLYSFPSNNTNQKKSSRGRPRKNSLIYKYDFDHSVYETENNNDIKAAVNKTFDPEMRMVNPKNHSPHLNYDSANIDSNIENNKSELTNIAPANEFNGIFGQEHTYSRSHHEELPSKFNEYSPKDRMCAKENYIVINQHFQFIQNQNIKQKFLINDSSSNGNRLTLTDKYSNNYILNKKLSSESCKKISSITSNALFGDTQGPRKKFRTEKDSTLYNNLRSNRTNEILNFHGIDALQVKKNTSDDNSDFFKEFMSLDLRYDSNEDVSYAVQEYFSGLDIQSQKNLEETVPSQDMPPISNEEEVYTSQVIDTFNMVNTAEEHEFYSQNSKKIDLQSTSTICFICNWLGKMCDLENHLKMMHNEEIYATKDGTLTIILNMDLISKNKKNNQYYCLFEHKEKLYVARFIYTYPDILSPIILSISPSEYINSNGNMMQAKSEFYLQVINFKREEEFLWSGIIDHINIPNKETDIGIHTNKKHGFFEFSMRSLELVPKNVAFKDIPKYLKSCIVQVHIYIKNITVLPNN